MENLAYIHLAVGYEDPNPDSNLRSLEELGLKSVVVGATSLALTAAIMTTANNAMALLVRGNTGAAVSEVQLALKNKGYSVGATDGVFGRQTETAVTSFQRDRGLAADGIVGPATAVALGLSNGGSGGGGGTPSGAVTVTAASGVNIRSGPGTNYRVVGGLGYGARVSTYGSSNGWYRVSQGWIAGNYTGAGSSSGGGGGGGSPSGAVRVTAPIGVNIRSGPGTGYGIVGGLGYGTQVSTYGSSNGWYRVSGGWVSSAYVQ